MPSNPSAFLLSSVVFSLLFSLAFSMLLSSQTSIPVYCVLVSMAGVIESVASMWPSDVAVYISQSQAGLSALCVGKKSINKRHKALGAHHDA